MKKQTKSIRNKKSKLRIEDEIKMFIVSLMALDIDPEEIEDQEMLFGGGLGLDSVKTLQIVDWIEQKYSIDVSDEDVTPDLFNSVQSLADYVKKAK